MLFSAAGEDIGNRSDIDNFSSAKIAQHFIISVGKFFSFAWLSLQPVDVI